MDLRLIFPKADYYFILVSPLSRIRAIIIKGMLIPEIENKRKIKQALMVIII